MDYELWNSFQERVKHVGNVINGRLELYWDVPEDYPVVEVFIYGVELEVENKRRAMEMLLNLKGITKETVELVCKDLEADYSRVDAYFERDISDEDLDGLVDVMQKFGDKKYSYNELMR